MSKLTEKRNLDISTKQAEMLITMRNAVQTMQNQLEASIQVILAGFDDMPGQYNITINVDPPGLLLEFEEEKEAKKK